MTSEDQQLKIELIGFTMSSVKELQAQLEAEPEVKDIQRRIHFKDGMQYRDVIHASLPHLTLILHLGAVSAALLGKAAMDAVKDKVKDRINEWLKTKGAADAEVTLLYGPDDKPLVKVKRKEMK